MDTERGNRHRGLLSGARAVMMSLGRAAYSIPPRRSNPYPKTFAGIMKMWQALFRRTR